MGTVRESFDTWLARASGLYGLWPLIPSGILSIVIAYASSGVDSIAQFGAFGWLTVALLTFFLAAAAFTLIARAGLWKIEARNRARLSGDSSPFDPMARVYENKRLYLRDLAPLGRRQVLGKKFINCEIIGPGTVVLAIRSNEYKPYPEMKDCLTFDVDAIEIGLQPRSQLAI